MTERIALAPLLGSRGRHPARNGPIRAIGIDLGTTTSVVAEASWDPADPDHCTLRLVEIAQATELGIHTDALVPSAVAILGEQIFVGEGARRIAAAGPGRELMQGRRFFLETKNDMGTKRVYPNAPKGFRTAPEIAAHLLRFLGEGARQENPSPVDRWVVTVPASFNAAQRADTLEAAKLAGLPLTPGDLLDEPTAAFIDYAARYEATLSSLPPGRHTLAVFDWGGGTCDVAILQLEVARAAEPAPVRVSPLAVSRYHRLGGGDVDAAIAYDALLPQLLAQNGLGPRDLTYVDKKRYAEPALRQAAEALKIGLSREVERLQGLGRLGSVDPAEVVKTQPGTHTIPIQGRTLGLVSPRLSLAELRKALEPFLDPDIFAARRTEYRTIGSGLAPLEDAIRRAGLTPEAIDLCLLVGGSVGLPGLREAVADFLPHARLLGYDRRHTDGPRLAVAGGAALHALSLALCGMPLLQPVCAERLALRTDGAPLALIERGTPLPFPGKEGYRELRGLAAPFGSEGGPVPLRVEIVGGDDGEERPVFAASWEIPAPVSQGEPLLAEVRMDENQELHIRLRKAETRRGQAFEGRVENPLTNALNPVEQELEAEQIELDLAARRVPKEKRRETVIGSPTCSTSSGRRRRRWASCKPCRRRSGVPTPSC